MLNGGAILTGGQVLGQGLSFLRNIIVAWHLTPADFGTAALVWLCAGFIELVSDLNVGTMMIRSPAGDDPAFGGTAHLIAALRGLGNALVMYVAAWPASSLFGVPEARWAFQALAVYIIIKSIAHLDNWRLQREMTFTPSVMSEVLSQALATALAWPVAALLHSYAALIVLLLIQVTAATVLSHVLARRRYVWRWDRTYAREILTFGWPLAVNGVVVFLIFQGDTAIVGAAPRLFDAAHYTKADLGLYSIAVTLTFAPALASARVVSSLLLPSLSEARRVPGALTRRYALSMEALAVLAGLTGILFALLGPVVILTMYGEQYVLAGLYVGWLGGMQAIRILRAGPTVAALVEGDSRNPMHSNVARLVGLLAAVACASRDVALVWFAVVGFVAEIVALAVSIQRLHGGRRSAIPAAASVWPALFACIAIVVGLLVTRVPPIVLGGGVAGAALVVAFLASAVLVLPAMRQELSSLLLRRSVIAAR